MSSNSMRKNFTVFLFFLFSFLLTAQDSLVIQGVKYKVDTLVHKHDAGLGTMHTKYNLPDFPLVVSVLEIDVSNPYVEVMSVLSNDSLRGLEQPSRMAERKSSSERNFLGGVNADFFVVSGADKGMPVNGQILGGQVAKPPVANRPLIAFDHAKQPFIDAMSFSGTIAANGSEHELHGVNSTRGADQLILYNQYIGTSTKTNQYGTEVIVSLDEDQWHVNQPVTCMVEEVQTRVGNAPVEPGKAVLSGHGTSETFLETLQAGDEVNIELSINLSSDASAFPDIEEMVGGDRVMLREGTVVDNNWPQLHPRTGAGYSGDKSKIILTVVDGRTDESAGVSTKQLADIMKLSGAAWAINLDGGGSSAMVVRDRISNSPSDGYERSVANALFFASTAPEADAVDYQLTADNISVSYGKHATINASTFDEFGDVVDYLDVPDATFRVEGSIGTIDENGLFFASETGSGKIIGEWNGLSDTLHVEVAAVSDILLSVNELTIDHLNTYQFNVYGQGSDGAYYPMPGELVDFESSDASLGEINSTGVFKGKSDGTVTVTASIQGTELQDECTVNVEIGRGHMLLDDFTEPSSWAISDYFMNDVTLSRDIFEDTGEEMLRLDYSMTYAGRTASIILSKEIDVYGIPDSLLLEAAGSGARTGIILSLDHNKGTCIVPSFSSSELQEYEAEISTGEMGQEDYPIPFKSIRISIEKDDSYVSGETYEGTIYLKALKAVYPEKDVPGQFNELETKNEDFVVFPNPVTNKLYIKSGAEFDSRLTFSLVSMSGQLAKKVELNGFNKGNVFPVSLEGVSEGIYLLNIYNEFNQLLKSEKVVISS